MTLGEKVRTLRLARGITQSSLCGDVITRNMLSRIENDAALPSLPTLRHLAEELGVSAGYFLEEEEDPLPYRKLTTLPAVKKLYRKKRYAECLALTASLKGDDEAALISAECLFGLGLEFFRREHFASAENFFRQAVETAESCLYDLSALTERAESYRQAIARARAEKLPDFLPPRDAPFSETAEYYLYAYMLHVTKTVRYDLAAGIYDTMKFQNTLYKKHINARLSMAARNNSRAVTLLGELLTSSTEEHTDPLFRLNVLIDMENASQLAGNYEQAYKCLVQKNALLAGFEK